MNLLDKQYLELVQDILSNGSDKQDRTGTGTRSVFGKQIRHKMSDGFPLLTTKKMAWKAMVTELIWFLRGDTDIKYLIENGCNIWNGDAYKNYKNKCKPDYGDGPDWMRPEIDFHYLTQEEFIEKIKTDPIFNKKWGNLGPIYGKQWRDWSGYTSEAHQKMNGESGVHIKGVDQFYNLINDLKNNPDSRRLIVNAWNVGELDKMTLPPCHYGFQLYTRELSLEDRIKLANKNKEWVEEVSLEYKRGIDCNLEALCNIHQIPKRTISLIWNQRSVDTGLGLPFNIASYGLLLEIIGKMVNMVPDELIGNLGDTHIYSNHIGPIQEQLGREPYKLPKLNFSKLFNIDIQKYSNQFENPLILDMFISRLSSDDFTLEGYESHPTIKLPLSN